MTVFRFAYIFCFFKLFNKLGFECFWSVEPLGRLMFAMCVRSGPVGPSWNGGKNPSWTNNEGGTKKKFLEIKFVPLFMDDRKELKLDEMIQSSLRVP